MPSDAEWQETFKRLDSDESSYRDEAKKLGVNPSTVQRRYLNYLNSRIGLARGELNRLEGAVADTRRKLEGLTEEYEKRDRELAGEYVRKEKAKETKFQSKMESLNAELARKEQEGEHRLKKIDVEIDAKNAIISEFTKKGLEPTKGLELLKKHKDLCSEISRKKELLNNLNSTIDERRRQWREEERNTASRRKEAAEKWDRTFKKKRRRNDKLDRQFEERMRQERLLTEEFERGAGTAFFETLRNLDSGDRLTILKCGLSSCTPHEIETLYRDDLDRRLQNEVLKLRRGMLKSLMKNFQ